MLARIRMLWVTVRDSLWLLPAVLTALAAGLAFLLTELEQAGQLTADSGSWLFRGGVEGARGVLSAIAGGLITVTGVVFSVTVVALQLASSQFTPRVLRSFIADRGNQVVLAMFIATFTYALLVLRTIESGGAGGEAFVPEIAVAVAILLVMISIGCLIYFIDHLARSIQIASILERVTRATIADAHRLFPEQVGRPVHLHSDPEDEGPSADIVSTERGYLQAVDSRSLFQLGERHRLVVRMEPHVGDLILPGSVLARVGAERLQDEIVSAVRTAFVLGSERTPEQDVEFGIIEIADIAVKALSPGINDPTTAFRCIDHLTGILHALSQRRPPDPERTREGRIHFVARHTSFERATSLAFDQIRHFGASNPAIAKRMLDNLEQLYRLVPERHRNTIVQHGEVLLRRVRVVVDEPYEIEEIERAAAWLPGLRQERAG